MTRWVFDFRALATTLRPLTDGPLCGAKTRIDQPCCGVAMRRRSAGPLVIGGMPLDVPRYGDCARRRAQLSGGRIV